MGGWRRRTTTGRERHQPFLLPSYLTRREGAMHECRKGLVGGPGAYNDAIIKNIRRERRERDSGLIEKETVG